MGRSDRRRPVAVLVLVSALAAPAAVATADGPLDSVDLRGSYTLRAASRLGNDQRLSEFLHSLSVELATRLGGWRLVGIGRARHEGRLEPEPYDDFDLRELYLERNTRRSTLRVGRQQVVWGKTDGLRLLDLVNPLDLREFILEDYEQSRIPLWMVNGEWFVGDQSFQLLVIPDVRFNERPDPRGELGVALDVPAGIPVRVSEAREPGGAPRNWELGGRWRTRIGRLELGVHGFYGWLDDPVPFRHSEPSGALRIDPEPRRLRLLGVAGDLPVGRTVLRFEATVSPDDYRDTTRGLERRESVRSAVGLDWTVNGLLVSPQIFYREVLDERGTLLGDDSRLLGTLLLRKELLHSKLVLRLFAAYEPEAEQYWLSPRATYQLGGRVEVALGADLFGGAPGSTFGRFRDRDRLVGQLTVHF
ncbi:MAG: hypothetical protein PVG07_03155 [Acidobacteriota bacterium]|jgi:hypothetical protein